jgi:diaminopimelate decarboxylase
MNARELIDAFGSPLYVYDETVLRRSCRALKEAFNGKDEHLLYAMKANANPELLRIIRDEGFDLDAVSLGEVLLGRRVGFAPDQISYTGNSASETELKAVAKEGVHVTLDAPTQLMAWSRVAGDRPFGLRINPDFGGGHHHHVITGGPDAKFGIEWDQLASVLESVDRLDLKLDRFHQHIGSGILDADLLLKAMDPLLKAARLRPEVATLDFGGGFGIPYRKTEAEFPLASFAAAARSKVDGLRRGRAGQLRAFFEPGRSVVATCGTLLVTVTAIKRGSKHTFVGTDSGQHHLIRPAFYGAFHQVENLTGEGRFVERVTVAGNICESGDLLAADVPLPKVEVGDLLAIRDVGAYGYSMSSNYNLRPRPAEVLLGPTGPTLIRSAETLEQILPPG